MTFEEWWEHFNSCCPLDITDEDIAKWAWETAFGEGYNAGFNECCSERGEE